MTSLHPHWQDTDDAPERRVPVRDGSATRQSVTDSVAAHRKQAVQNIPAASRRPAAFVGIALFVVAGFAVFQGFSHFKNLTGQVTPAPVTIRIRSTGVDPLTVTVQPGATVTWTNNDTIPHILASDTLPSDGGTTFITSAIFPGSSTHVLIPLAAAPGTYTYISKTSQSVSGQIVIEASSTAFAQIVQQPASSVASVPTVVPAMQQQTPSAVQAIPVAQPATTVTPVETTTASTVTPATTSNGLPYNPHTVGNGDVAIPARQGANSPAISSTTSRPASAPETGPEVWVTILLSIGALSFVTRKSFRTVLTSH